MLDIKFIRENADLVQDGAKKKRIDFDVKKLIEVDDKRKSLSQELENKRARQNEVSTKIPTATTEERESLIKEMQPLKEEMQKLEEELKVVMAEWQLLMVSVPNIPDMSVPEGDTDLQNQEVKKWGDIKKFDFTPKGHVELMQNLGMLDLERGAKVDGFR